jgi:catechol 2,3-dioxygenase
MQVEALGHVVLKVRDIERSEAFYAGLLGMPIVSRISDPPMTFFSLATTRNHHDFAIMETGVTAALAQETTTGLAHVAFRIGTSPEDLRPARGLLEASGTPVLYEAERGFSRSIHVLDPDRNEIELYVDVARAICTSTTQPERGPSQFK